MGVGTADLARLFASERGRLKSLINRMVGNRATAEELVQQAFANVLSTTDWDRVDSHTAYLTRTARNLALNHLRAAKLRITVELGEGDWEAVADPQPSPEMTALHRSELRRVLAAIAQLPPRRRQVFVLSRFDGLTYDQIADRMGITRNTVMVQIANALVDLDRRLGQE